HHWLWHIQQPGLLAGQEQLGQQLGYVWLHHDVTEQVQSVWDCHRCLVPHTLVQSPFLPSL
ncbi:hypothetical protein GBAR_LOCUS18299, partial [Geodia barretti]